MFIKVVEKIVIDNDIYFFEVVNNKVIINNNYNGITVLNTDLSFEKTINIIEDMVIYSSYISEEKNGIVIFCPENKKLIYINFNSYKSEIIYINDSMKDVIFSNIYIWEENSLLLYSYDGCCYEVNIHGKEIKVVESKENSQEYKEFNNFNNVSIEDSIGLIDTLYNDDMSVYVYEDRIKVIENNQEIILNTNCKSIFLKARFIKCNEEKCLIVLSTNKNDTCENNISIYKL